MTGNLEGAGSLAPFFRIVRPALSRDLVPDISFARMERLASGLPPAYGFIFECWLGSEKADVDLQLFYRAGEGAALGQSTPIDNATWGAVRSLFAKFSERAEDLTLGLWIEFDLGDEDLGEADPRLGFAWGRFPFERYLDTLRCVYDCLGRTVPADEALLRRCYAAIPSGAYLYATGTGLAPTYAPLRWCLSFADPAQLPAYLEAVGWPHLAPSLDVPGLRHVAMALDLSNAIGPRIGVEYYLENDAYEPFLRALAEQKLCRDHWIAPYLASRGVFTSRDAAEWPAPLAALSALSGREASIVLNPVHVKVTFDGARPVAVKGYIYGNYIWAAPRDRQPSPTEAC